MSPHQVLNWPDVAVTFEGAVIREALRIGSTQLDRVVCDLEGRKRTILAQVDRARELMMTVVTCHALLIPDCAPGDRLRADQSGEHIFREAKYALCRYCF